MPESYRVRLKPEILRLTGLFFDLLQLIAMNIWLFHRKFAHLSTKDENKPNSGSIQNDQVTTNP
ncbi:hypothetical protein DERP_004668 [Dermatophagoides pteronyssinus]|uniref:Uncharacterized protein n=1 Tax=Dermatophagoides pteronyssinus TaxID=6956 RepID=A0ABQ8JPE7_DERPT|nr:hypothetical protein DERP_004668 [Dermatophagoides pteronyssinus]